MSFFFFFCPQPFVDQDAPITRCVKLSSKGAYLSHCQENLAFHTCFNCAKFSECVKHGGRHCKRADTAHKLNRTRIFPYCTNLAHFHDAVAVLNVHSALLTRVSVKWCNALSPALECTSVVLLCLAMLRTDAAVHGRIKHRVW